MGGNRKGRFRTYINLLIVWFIMSPGKIRSYSEEGSLSEKFVMDINGAPNHKRGRAVRTDGLFVRIRTGRRKKRTAEKKKPTG